MSPSKCSQADVAKKANVSVATVSLALRGDARINSETRELVMRVAGELGYVRDPVLAKLMTHLKKGRRVAGRGCLLALCHPPFRSSFVDRILASASAEAKLLGYALEVRDISKPAAPQQTLDQVLYHQGIEGLLILPSDVPLDLSACLTWERYAVVSVCSGLVAPKFHNLSPDWYQVVMDSLTLLQAKGFRRVGLVLAANLNYLNDKLLSLIFRAFQMIAKHRSVPPFYYKTAAWPRDESRVSAPYKAYLEENRIPVLKEGFMAWYEQHQPEIVLVDRQETVVLLSRLFADVGRRPPEFATLSRDPSSPIPGMCLPAEELGLHAVRFLDHNLRYGRTSVSATPIKVRLDARWLESDESRGT